MNNKWKLSFNKKSAGDIASAVFILASATVSLMSAFGFTLPAGTSDNINDWVSLSTLILGSGGLLRNTSTGTSKSNMMNVSSEDASSTAEKGVNPSEDAK